MSRAFMPFYFGDYLRDTGHLTTEQHGAYILLLGHCWEHEGVIPLDDNERAAIAKLTDKRWRQIKAPIERFFNPDGTQKRVSKELAKADAVSMKRKIAGAKGGFHSAVAKIKQTPKQMVSKPPSKMPANDPANLPANEQQNSSNRIHNHIQNLTSSSESLAASAREAAPQQVIENQDKSPAGELATALRGGALTRPPDAEPAAQESKPPSEVKRAEFDAMFAARRASSNAVKKEETERP